MIQFGSFGYDEDENKDPIYFLDTFNCPFRFELSKKFWFTTWHAPYQMFLDRSNITRNVNAYMAHDLLGGWKESDLYGNIIL